MLVKILLGLLQGIVTWFKAGKSQENASKAEATKAALTSVGDSIKTTNEIKEAQDAIDKETPVSTDNDAFGDGDWNNPTK